MDEVINNVINNIAEKLGIAVEYIMPALVKYNIAENIIHLIWAFLWIISAIITFKIAINSYKNNKATVDDAFDYPSIVISSICCIISIVFAICELSDGLNIIKWIMAPEGATMAYVLDKIK